MNSIQLKRKYFSLLRKAEKSLVDTIKQHSVDGHEEYVAVAVSESYLNLAKELALRIDWSGEK